MNPRPDFNRQTVTVSRRRWTLADEMLLIEREQEYQDDIRRRIVLCRAGPDERSREAAKAKTKDKPPDHGPLFA